MSKYIQTIILIMSKPCEFKDPSEICLEQLNILKNTPQHDTTLLHTIMSSHPNECCIMINKFKSRININDIITRYFYNNDVDINSKINFADILFEDKKYSSLTTKQCNHIAISSNEIFRLWLKCVYERYGHYEIDILSPFFNIKINNLFRKGYSIQENSFEQFAILIDFCIENNIEINTNYIRGLNNNNFDILDFIFGNYLEEITNIIGKQKITITETDPNKLWSKILYKYNCHNIIKFQEKYGYFIIEGAKEIHRIKDNHERKTKKLENKVQNLESIIEKLNQKVCELERNNNKN